MLLTTVFTLAAFGFPGGFQFVTFQGVSNAQHFVPEWPRDFSDKADITSQMPEDHGSKQTPQVWPQPKPQRSTTKSHDRSFSLSSSTDSGLSNFFDKSIPSNSMISTVQRTSSRKNWKSISWSATSEHHAPLDGSPGHSGAIETITRVTVLPSTSTGNVGILGSGISTASSSIAVSLSISPLETHDLQGGGPTATNTVKPPLQPNPGSSRSSITISPDNIPVAVSDTTATSPSISMTFKSVAFNLSATSEHHGPSPGTALSTFTFSEKQNLTRGPLRDSSSFQTSSNREPTTPSSGDESGLSGNSHPGNNRASSTRTSENSNFLGSPRPESGNANTPKPLASIMSESENLSTKDKASPTSRNEGLPDDFSGSLDSTPIVAHGTNARTSVESSENENEPVSITALPTSTSKEHILGGLPSVNLSLLSTTTDNIPQSPTDKFYGSPSGIGDKSSGTSVTSTQTTTWLGFHSVSTDVVSEIRFASTSRTDSNTMSNSTQKLNTIKTTDKMSSIATAPKPLPSDPRWVPSSTLSDGDDNATNGPNSKGPADAGASNSSHLRASSIGISVGAVAGAMAYGAGMLWFARRYRRRHQPHQRLGSNVDISAPVMTGNSLGWS